MEMEMEMETLCRCCFEMLGILDDLSAVRTLLQINLVISTGEAANNNTNDSPTQKKKKNG